MRATDKSVSHQRPAFLYNHTPTHEVSINLAYLKIAYSTTQVRANIVLMAGTYAEYNLSTEQNLLKNIYEANVGIRLSPKHDTWVDAGVFASHIGFEGAISSDCPTLIRSLLAESSPYYKSGVKLTHQTHNSKWLASVLLLNGW